MKAYSVTIGQFAKAPIIGTVKTRMAPVLSEQECLTLHKKLVERVVKNCAVSLREITKLRYELWVTEAHCFFEELLAKRADEGDALPVVIRQQGAGGLGDRLARCLRENSQNGSIGAVIGSDCISIDGEYVLNMWKAFQDNHSLKAVIGPATDGGFVLLALKEWNDAIFHSIEWGEGSVLAQLKQNLSELDYSYELLPALHDIDRPEDLGLTKGIGT